MQDLSKAKIPAGKVEARIQASPRPRPRAKPRQVLPAMPRISVRWCVIIAATKAITQTNAPSLRRHEAVQVRRLQAHQNHPQHHHLRAAALPTAARTAEPVPLTESAIFTNPGGRKSRAGPRSVRPVTAVALFMPSPKKHTRQRRQKQVARRNSLHEVR